MLLLMAHPNLWGSPEFDAPFSSGFCYGWYTQASAMYVPGIYQTHASFFIWLVYTWYIPGIYQVYQTEQIYLGYIMDILCMYLEYPYMFIICIYHASVYIWYIVMQTFLCIKGIYPVYIWYVHCFFKSNFSALGLGCWSHWQSMCTYVRQLEARQQYTKIHALPWWSCFAGKFNLKTIRISDIATIQFLNEKNHLKMDIYTVCTVPEPAYLIFLDWTEGPDLPALYHAQQVDLLRHRTCIKCWHSYLVCGWSRGFYSSLHQPVGNYARGLTACSKRLNPTSRSWTLLPAPLKCLHCRWLLQWRPGGCGGGSVTGVLQALSLESWWEMGLRVPSVQVTYATYSKDALLHWISKKIKILFTKGVRSYTSNEPEKFDSFLQVNWILLCS
jgi:hypothetical protein